jgi:hypothetical protein
MRRKITKTISSLVIFFFMQPTPTALQTPSGGNTDIVCVF